MFSFTNHKFLIKKFCEEKNRNLEKKSSTFKETTENSDNSKKASNNFTFNLSKFIPIKIYKKNNTYYLSLNSIANKYKFIGVLVSRKIREKNPKVWNNVVAVGALLTCVFLFCWRLLDFKYTLISNQQYLPKPLITKKVALDKHLTLEDLSFIYEKPLEYELDKETLQLVIDYRLRNELPINKNYDKDVKKGLLENKNRKALF